MKLPPPEANIHGYKHARIQLEYYLTGRTIRVDILVDADIFPELLIPLINFAVYSFQVPNYDSRRRYDDLMDLWVSHLYDSVRVMAVSILSHEDFVVLQHHLPVLYSQDMDAFADTSYLVKSS